MQIETKRLLLREMNQQDFSALFNIFSHPETMKHYPAPFDKKRVKDWIEWNIQNYRNYGFGLWSVVLKETGQVIGDCGITIQNINGDLLPEIGYHVHKNYWKRGYGSEAAKAVRDYAFQNTDYEILYSYVKYTNLASASTAQKIGMKRSMNFLIRKIKFLMFMPLLEVNGSTTKNCLLGQPKSTLIPLIRKSPQPANQNWIRVHYFL